MQTRVVLLSPTQVVFVFCHSSKKKRHFPNSSVQQKEGFFFFFITFRPCFRRNWSLCTILVQCFVSDLTKRNFCSLKNQGVEDNSQKTSLLQPPQNSGNQAAVHHFGQPVNKTELPDVDQVWTIHLRLSAPYVLNGGSAYDPKSGCAYVLCSTVVE